MLVRLTAVVVALGIGVAVAHALGAFTPRVDAADLAAARQRGREIYTTGTSPSGSPFTVRLPLFGNQERTFPASRYACVNCHGQDGLPTTEAGVGIPNIQSHRLHSPVQIGQGSNRTRAAYDAATLRRAIRFGVDASGNALNAMMPRFEIADGDLDDLVAYLENLGTEHMPGVGEKQVDVAAVLPGGEPGLRDAVAETISAFALETNRRGGIYGRELRITVLDRDEWQRRARDPAERDRWLCLVATPDATNLERQGLPVVGDLRDEHLVDPALDERVFHLHPSQATQLRVAVDHYCQVLAHPDAQFDWIEDGSPELAAVGDEVAAQVAKYPDARLRRLRLDDAATAKVDAAAPPRVVLAAGAPEWTSRVLEGLADRADCAAVYCTHRLARSVASLSADAADKLRLMLPVPLPAADDPEVAWFQRFLGEHGLGETFVAQRVASLAACIALAEALKRCGARVSRERLVHELEGFYRFRPGLFPPLTFRVNRHVGAGGAQVARLDPVSRHLTAWSDWSEPK